MNDQIVMLERVADKLAPFDHIFVYTGGITIGLHLDPVSADDVRPTKDVDCVVEVNSLLGYYALGDQLRQLGLREDQGGPLCRWNYDDLIIDIMPTEPTILGFTNSWYGDGISQSSSYTLPNGRQIRIFSIVYLLASKIEAFTGRGKGDFYGSHDLEDIMLLLDGCNFLEDEVNHAASDVRSYIKSWFESEQEWLYEVAPNYLSYAAVNAGRDRLLRELIQRLAKS
jgi:hypothetical protein